MSTQKLQELILYITRESSDDPHFGATKLNKILFFADFLAYGYLGEPITEATYIHQEYGPVPRELLKAQEELLESRKARLEEREVYGHIQRRLVPLVNADSSLFTPDEIQIADEVIRKLEPMNATELSGFTHRFRPWRDTVNGEVIPYFTVFVMDDLPATRSDKEWALAKIQELEAAEHA